MDICSCFYHSYLFVCNQPIKDIVTESVILLNGVTECSIIPEFLEHFFFSSMTMHPVAKEVELFSSKIKEESAYKRANSKGTQIPSPTISYIHCTLESGS